MDRTGAVCQAGQAGPGADCCQRPHGHMGPRRRQLLQANAADLLKRKVGGERHASVIRLSRARACRTYASFWSLWLSAAVTEWSCRPSRPYAAITVPYVLRSCAGTAKTYFKSLVDVMGQYADKGYVAPTTSTAGLPFLLAIILGMFAALAVVVSSTSGRVPFQRGEEGYKEKEMRAVTEGVGRAHTRLLLN